MIELKKIGLVGSSVSEEFGNCLISHKPTILDFSFHFINACAGGENFKATKVLRLFEDISDESIALLVYAHNNLGIKVSKVL